MLLFLLNVGTHLANQNAFIVLVFHVELMNFHEVGKLWHIKGCSAPLKRKYLKLIWYCPCAKDIVIGFSLNFSGLDHIYKGKSYFLVLVHVSVKLTLSRTGNVCLWLCESTMSFTTWSFSSVYVYHRQLTEFWILI